MRVLLLGTGSIGRRHARNLRALDATCDFVVVRSGARRDEYTDSLGATVVPDLQQGLIYEPDVAVVATPSAVHAKSLIPTLDAGLPVYVEKPVVTRVGDMADVAEALERRTISAPTMAGCNLRFLPSLGFVRDLVRSGALGRVVRAHFECGQWLPDWRETDYRQSYSANAEAGGGVLLDLIHEFDACRWILGEVRAVAAAADQLSGLEIDTEDVAVALLRGEAGTLVSVGLDYVARRRIRRYEFVGTDGTAVWDFAASRVLVNGVPTQALPTDAFDVGATYVSAMREFLECAAVGSPTSQEISQALGSTALALRCKELAEPWQ